MPKDTHEKRIAGAASIIGSATALSRILGYIRDAAVAYVFGAGMLADAFFMAFRVSNLLRRLVGEGALTTSFVPIFTEELTRRTKEGARELASSVFTLFGLILIVLTVLCVYFSEEIVWLMAPGFADDPEKFAVTVSLTALMFPYMVFIGLMAIAMGVLNSLRHFTAPALSPVLFNLAIIASIFAVTPFLAKPVYALALGVLIGGFLQLALQLPFMSRYGMAPRVSFRFRDPAVKKIFALMGPATFGVGIYQLNIFVTLWFSSQLAEGSVSYLYYAGRIMELPLGIFSVAVSTAVLPSLSEHVARKDWEGFRGSLSFALRIVNFVTIPAMFALFVLSYPIIDVLFLRGEFGSEAASGTAIALYYYAVGLVPVSVARILTAVFYAQKDSVTPVWAGVASFVANVVFCFALIGPMGHAGLALATSLAAIANCTILLVVLRYRFGRFGARGIVGSGLKATGASVVMTVLLFLIIRYSGFEGLSTVFKGGVVMICLVAGILTYTVSAMAARSDELMFLKGILLRRKERRSGISR